MCRYCFRPATVTIIMRNGVWRTLLKLPRRTIGTCGNCVQRVVRR